MLGGQLEIPAYYLTLGPNCQTGDRKDFKALVEPHPLKGSLHPTIPISYTSELVLGTGRRVWGLQGPLVSAPSFTFRQIFRQLSRF